MPATQSTNDAFDRIGADLDYPMTIVTTAYGDERAGCLVGFWAQCGIEPLRLVVWLSKANRTCRVARRASGLLVHFLAAEDRGLAALFGAETGDEVDKFSQCRWEPGPEGLPVLSDCARWMAGHVLDRIDTGDHVGHLLEPFAATADRPWTQLGFQTIKDLDAGHPA